MDNSSSLEDLNDDRLDSLKTATSHPICAINNDMKQPRQDSRQGGGGDGKHGRGSGGRQGGGPEQKSGEGRKNSRKSKKRYEIVYKYIYFVFRFALSSINSSN